MQSLPAMYKNSTLSVSPMSTAGGQQLHESEVDPMMLHQQHHNLQTPVQYHNLPYKTNSNSGHGASSWANPVAKTTTTTKVGQGHA